MIISSLTTSLLVSGLAVPLPAKPVSPPALGYDEARIRSGKVDDLLRRARRGEELIADVASPEARIFIALPGNPSVIRIEKLTSRALRDWIGSCTEFGMGAVSTSKNPYDFHIILQCDSEKLSGDFRAIFTFEAGRVTGVRIGREGNVPSTGPIIPIMSEHQQRNAIIDALLDAMKHRDQKAFLAVGGDKIFFSSDPEAIFSAVVGPRASRLRLDTFASLSSCKVGRPASFFVDWYVIAWQCPPNGPKSTVAYSFKFAGHNLVAIQAARPAPKFKFN